MLAVAELTPHVGLSSACQAFARSRGLFVYRDRVRRRTTVSQQVTGARPRPPLAFSIAEQDLLLGLLDSERFADVAPAAVFATLLDEGRYLGSIRTMYRLLAAQSQVGERRRQRSHPAYAKPELLATRPNEVWSWDITKMKGPAKWTCFHLYVILDIYSRYVVGWLIAHRESAELAEQLIADTVGKENIAPGPLTLHADRGAPFGIPHPPVPHYEKHCPNHNDRRDLRVAETLREQRGRIWVSLQATSTLLFWVFVSL
jgi:putative transposase